MSFPYSSSSSQKFWKTMRCLYKCHFYSLKAFSLILLHVFFEFFPQSTNATLSGVFHFQNKRFRSTTSNSLCSCHILHVSWEKLLVSLKTLFYEGFGPVCAQLWRNVGNVACILILSQWAFNQWSLLALLTLVILLWERHTDINQKWHG